MKYAKTWISAVLLLAGVSPAYAAQPVQSSVGNTMIAIVCSQSSGCFLGGPSVLSEQLDVPVDSQMTALNPLSVSGFATANAQGCTATASGSISATWTSANAGSVTSSTSWNTGPGGASILVSPGPAPGWTYEFVPDGNGSMDFQFDGERWFITVDGGGSTQVDGPAQLSVPLEAGVAKTVSVYHTQSTPSGHCINASDTFGGTFTWAISDAPSVPAMRPFGLAILGIMLVATAILHRRKTILASE